jgi:hypothetical protein
VGQSALPPEPLEEPEPLELDELEDDDELVEEPDDELDDELEDFVDEVFELVLPAVPEVDPELVVDALPLVPPELVVLERLELWAPVVEPAEPAVLVVAPPELPPPELPPLELPVELVEIVPEAPHPAAKINAATVSRTKAMVNSPRRQCFKRPL